MPGTGAYSWSSEPDLDLVHARRRAGQRAGLRLALAEVAPVGMAVAIAGRAASAMTKMTPVKGTGAECRECLG